MKTGLREPARRSAWMMRPWQRADIRPAVAADLGLVAHAAQAHVDKLPAQGAANRLTEAGLADAGRPHQAQDGAADFRCRRRVSVGAQLHDGQEFQNAVLDPIQVEVVLVEDALGVADVEVVLGGDAPRQVGNPLEIGAHHGVLGAGGRDAGQAIDLAVGLFRRLLG